MFRARNVLAPVIGLSSCLAPLAWCPAASAQYSQNPDAEYVQISAEGWLFAPATDTQAVLGFLAVPDGVAPTGLNIALLWYEREADGSWSSWGWEQPQTGEAVWWVRTHLGDDSAFTLDIDLNAAAAGVAPETALAPSPLGSGLFLDDPLQPVVQQSEDPAGLVDVLATTGWQVAPELSALDAGGPIPCDGQAVNAVQLLLNDLARDVELGYFGSSSTLAVCAAPCTCATSVGVTICGDWRLTGSQEFGSLKYCDWERTCHKNTRKRGEYRTCFSCDDDSTSFWTVTTQTIVAAEDDCDPPSSN